MQIERLRSLIRESVKDHMKEIEAVAEAAAMEARLAEYGKAIETCENKITKAESLEEVQDLVDEGKLNELKKKLKDLKKAKAKLENQKAKKNKGKEVTTDAETDKMDEAADKMDEASDKMDETYVEETYTMDEMDMKDEALNESFLKMQKLAGVITEAQYNSKKKALVENQPNEGEYSDWWAKANIELGLDFDDDIYSYIDLYDEPWQGKFAEEVTNIDASDYEDFKNQVKQLYDEYNPF